MSKDVLLFDPQGPALRSFRSITPSVAALQSTLSRLGTVDTLLPQTTLTPVGTGVAVADGLVADLLFVDNHRTLTVLTGMFLSRSDDKYDNLFASDLLQACSEVLSWDSAALTERLPAAASAGAQPGRLRLVVPLARSSSPLEKVARLLGAAVSLHIVRWQAYADEAGRILLFQDALTVAPLAVAPSVPAAPAINPPVAAAVMPSAALIAPEAALQTPQAFAPATPAAPAPQPLHAEALAALLERESAHLAASRAPEPGPDSITSMATPVVAAPPPVSGPSTELEGEEEAFAADAATQTLREANFINQAREGDSRLEGAYRRMLAWARGNGRVGFSRTPSMLYRPWPDLPVTVLHALPGGRVELRLRHVLPQLSSATITDVQRRLRLLAGREIDPQATLVLEPPQSLDEDIFSVLLSTLRLVAYSRPVSGFRRRAEI